MGMLSINRYNGSGAPDLLTDSVEIKTEPMDSAIKLEPGVPIKLEPSLEPSGPPPNVDDVLASLMPLRSVASMPMNFLTRRVSNRGRVIAPMGTMPNHSEMFDQLTHLRERNQKAAAAALHTGVKLE